MIGNAVPVNLSYALAKVIKLQFAESENISIWTFASETNQPIYPSLIF
jgi:hypothetical protein